MTYLVIGLDDGNVVGLSQPISDDLRLATLPCARTPINPTATIGLSAVNGSAVTAMSSDSAPALSQAITPVWTNSHSWSVGKGVQFAAGTNARVGSFTLTAGGATVANTSVTANTMIFFSKTGTSLLNLGVLGSITKTAGTGFSVSSTNILDTATYQYLLIETY